MPSKRTTTNAEARTITLLISDWGTRSAEYAAAHNRSMNGVTYLGSTRINEYKPSALKAGIHRKNSREKFLAMSPKRSKQNRTIRGTTNRLPNCMEIPKYEAKLCRNALNWPPNSK